VFEFPNCYLKVLGDLVESIAGAILVDTGFNLERVWAVMKPLLSPLVTPQTLIMHPVVELFELCHLKGFWLDTKLTTDGNMTTATVEVKCPMMIEVIKSNIMTYP